MKLCELQIGFITSTLFVASFAAFADPRHVIVNFAGSGVKGFSGDGGLATEAQLNGPNGVVRGPDGALYICDTGNQRIRKVTRDGKITTVAGTGEAGWNGDGGPATATKLNEPYEVRFDSAGNLYWVERVSATVRRCDLKTGVVTTTAGTGESGFSGDGGLANKARLNEPHSIGFDKSGDLYICDVKNYRIRKIDMKTGKISTFSGTGRQGPALDGAMIKEVALSGPRALDFDKDDNLWLALREGNAVLKFDLAAGVVRHLAGTGVKGFSGDGGPARNAELSGPKGISVAVNGDVFIADTENHAIRRMDVNNGTIHMVAGTGNRGDGSGSDPLKCELARPHGIFVDRDGLVFIGDTEANRVRVIHQ